MTPKIEVFCASCGKPKLIYPCRYHPGHFFCNSTCKAEYQRKPKVTLTCEGCQEPFEVTEFFSKGPKKARFCSVKCRDKANSQRMQGEGNVNYTEKEIRHCKNCTKPFEVPPKSTRLYCSQPCARTAISTTRIREKHWLWKGGKQTDYGPHWQIIARQIRKRDKHTCQCCGKCQPHRAKAFPVHHKVPLRKFNGDFDKANHPDNLITLCPVCHRIEETKIIDR